MNQVTALKRYQALEDYLQKWFHEPDMQAIRIVLAAGVSHYVHGSKAVWLFVVGPSGSGKTDMAINMCQAFPNSFIMGDLTPSTFLSGFGKGKGNYGLLKQVGDSGFLLWKDFTTILGKRVETRTEIIGQLREIHDGRISRRTGASTPQFWEGKITCLAAATPALERAWAVNRDMGERWLHVRWRSGDPVMAAQAAHHQMGVSDSIEKGLIQVTRDFLDLPRLEHSSPLQDIREAGLVYLAQVVAILRTQVERDGFGRKIVSSPVPEIPTRLASGMGSIARGHATLFRRKVGPEDLAAARRIALDSIPTTRMIVLQCIPDESTVLWGEIVKASGLPESTVTWVLDELITLGVVRETRENKATEYRFTDRFQQLKFNALLNAPSWGK